ncbi:hypothetical protein MGN70_011924 [Eutypa lata]|nr:hypothetical protein MGN70_011924 [Eutypa lata]
MLRAIVVGGGIAGLSASVSLRRAGHIVHVYEKTQLDNEVGAAINVPPNAARFLVGHGTGSWGLDPVRSRFVKATTLEWCDPFTTAAAKPPSESGATILLSHANNAARYGAELWLAHRVDLHAALRRLATQAADDGDKVPAAPPVTIHPNAQVVHYTAPACPPPKKAPSARTLQGVWLACLLSSYHANALVIAVEDPDVPSITLASGEIVEADVVIGADGIHSIASEAVLGYENEAVTPAHYNYCYRFLIPASVLEADPDTRFWNVGSEGKSRIFADNEKGRRLVAYVCRE